MALVLFLLVVLLLVLLLGLLLILPLPSYPTPSTSFARGSIPNAYATTRLYILLYHTYSIAYPTYHNSHSVRVLPGFLLHMHSLRLLFASLYSLGNPTQSFRFDLMEPTGGGTY